MHDSALATGAAFFERYVTTTAPRVLDVGARDVNGSLRSRAPKDATYIGVDIEAGRGVDHVLEDPYVLPFADGSFDAVVSSSCFEHTPFFWVAFLEQVRVLRPGGHLYASAPSNGWYHGYPFDHWRFYPDAGLALEAWARKGGHELSLVESFVAAQADSIWNDFVMIFERRASPSARDAFVVEAFEGAYNARRFDREGLQNLQLLTEDERRIATLEMKVSVLAKRLREGAAS
jgi:SAM-dependent methyltransferase